MFIYIILIDISYQKQLVPEGALFINPVVYKIVDKWGGRMELMTISEAVRRLGYKSRSQLYKLLNDGYLYEHVHVQQHMGQRLLDIEGLREKLHVICQ